jgi:hypothetical protein
MPSMRFMVNLPPQTKSSMEFMKAMKTEQGSRFLRLIQHVVTSVLSQTWFRVTGDPRLIPRADFRLKHG